jgi:pSer/pThr/pTyr-binding forkhead associated (FHA) protein
MPLTVIVRIVVGAGPGADHRLTFDGAQRVVIGRGAGSDVRLPDASVSHRHACVEAKGASGGDFLITDEGSTNGTFVGHVRIAPHTSRIVRSGDAVRVGRVWLELRLDQSPVTRDVAGATRDLALALVSQAMARAGKGVTAAVLVVEGADQGARLALVDEGRAYRIGRGAPCDLPLADADASREHASVVRRGNVVAIRDLGGKNGTWLGDSRAPEQREVPWRPAQMVRIGRTVLALEEPVRDALARIEREPDEPLALAEAAGSSAAESAAASASPGATGMEGAETAQASVIHPVPARPPPRSPRSARPRLRLSATDTVVVVAALSVLAVSIAGLVWLLRG